MLTDHNMSRPAGDGTRRSRPPFPTLSHPRTTSSGYGTGFAIASWVCPPFSPSREMEMPDTSSARVLVVEDNDATREVLDALLRREGCEVTLTANGEEALNHLHGGLKPDLILLDMLMPAWDGWRFLQERDVNPKLRRIPVVVMSGIGVLCPEWAEAHGCAGFVPKPVEAHELLKEVQRVLALRPPAGHALGAGDPSGAGIGPDHCAAATARNRSCSKAGSTGFRK